MKKRIRKLIGALMLIVALVVMQLPAFGSEAATTETKKTAEFVVDSEGLLTKYNGSSSSVVIPANVVSIATDAFRDNAKITSIVIPDSVKKIEPYAFWNCSSLTMVSIGTGLTEIGDFVFANCKNLASIKIPSNIKTIGIYAFQDDINLTDITIPMETMDIHQTAFDGCYKLVIHAPEGSYPWKYAQGFYIRQQEFPEYEEVYDYDPTPVVVDTTGTDTTPSDTDTDPADNSGQNNTPEDNNGQDGTPADSNEQPADDSAVVIIQGEEEYDPLASVHVVGNKAVVFMNSASPTVYFGNMGNDTETEDISDGSDDGSGSGSGADGGPGTAYGSNLPKYTIVDGNVVADQAYYNNKDLSYVTLPETVKEIGQFSYARSSLKSIVLPAGLEKVSYGAFYHCDNLDYVTIPGSVTKIEPKAFTFTKWMNGFESGEGEGDFLISGDALVAYRGNSADVTIPEGIRIIASQVFADHPEIRSVTFPGSVEYIGEEAFCNCSSLSDINLEDTSLISADDRSFYGTALNNVKLPDTVTSHGINAFDTECVISQLGNNVIAITHENTAERLSNSDYRANAYQTGLTEVSVSRGDIGVNVTGVEGASASLEGADEPYYLNISRQDGSDVIDTARQRAAEFLNDRNLINGVYYDLELTDGSGITITRLGHAALTVAIPVPDAIGAGQRLTVMTVDRNGQLEELDSEVVNSDGARYIRFRTYHLSPFAVFGTGETLGEGEIIEAQNVLEYYGANVPKAEDMQEITASENLKGWLYSKRWRFLPAGMLVITGLILIFAKFGGKTRA